MKILHSLFIIFFLSPFCSNGQWVLCPGETPHDELIFSKTVQQPIYDNGSITSANIKVDVRWQWPSCPGAFDGMIELIDMQVTVEGKVLHDINEFKPYWTKETFEESRPFPSIVSGQGTFVQNVGKSDIRFLFMEGPTLPIEVTFPMGTLFPNSLPSLSMTESANETKPGFEDGFVRMATNLSECTGAITWDNGSISTCNSAGNFRRPGMESRLHAFTWEAEWNTKKCCREGAVQINSNKCRELVFGDAFNNGMLSPDYFVASGSVDERNGVAIFDEDSELYVHIDMRDQDKALAIEALTGGNAEVSVQFLNNMLSPLPTEIGFSKTGELLAFVRDASSVENFVYCVIEAEAGFFIDLINFYSFTESICPLDVRANLMRSNASSFSIDTVIHTCVNDSKIHFNGFGLTGGVSPYTFEWDLDGDMIFEISDTVTTPVVFDSVGTYVTHFRVRDLLGQTDTSRFEFIVHNRDTLEIENITDSETYTNLEIITLCSDAPDLVLNAPHPDAYFNYNTPAFNGVIFSPSIADSGVHIIECLSDYCQTPAVLVIEVRPSNPALIRDINVIQLCEEVFQPSEFLAHPLDGVFILDDTIAITNDSLDPSTLSIGLHTLVYITGNGRCFNADTNIFEVQPSPIASVLDADTFLFNDVPSFDLSQLLDSNSTTGGVWSGGSYVIDGAFNPDSLEPGFYQVIYSVGDGSCLVSDTTEIEVRVINSINVHSTKLNIRLFPNPNNGSFTLCLDKYHENAKARIFDSSGKLIQSIPVELDCTNFNLREFYDGLFLIEVIDLNTGVQNYTRILKLGN